MMKGYKHSEMKRTRLSDRHTRVGAGGDGGGANYTRSQTGGVSERKTHGGWTSGQQTTMARVCWLQEQTKEARRAEKLSELSAYCCVVQGTRGTTTVGKLAAMNSYHEHRMG